MKKLSCFIALLFLIFTSCEDNHQIEITYKYYTDEEIAILNNTLHLNNINAPYDYHTPLPDYLKKTFASSIVSNNEATLGRVLFYDKNLSHDKKISCASCHDQKLAFADSKPLSDGTNGKVTTRNSLALGAVLSFKDLYGSESFGKTPFFWDNSATSVQEQSERTIANPNEMGMDLDLVVDRVKNLDYYGPLFKHAYQTNDIDRQKILDAIAAFINSISAFRTKFDKEMSAHFNKFGSTHNADFADFSGFTVDENKGKTIYMQKCANCHGRSLGASEISKANNGLYQQYTDKGIGSISGKSDDMGLFKVPTLRNITLTAPYMHDGSLATLDAVLDHYSSGIKDHQNLDNNLRSNGQPVKFNFTNEEKSQLIAFFNTLVDHELLVDDRFSDPFKK